MPDGGDGASAGGQVEVTVLGLSGETIAELVCDASQTVGEAARRVAELAPAAASRFLRYQLVHHETTLAPERTLLEAVGCGKVTLRACALPVVTLTVPGVSGTAMLPDSGDVVLASTGPICATTPEKVPLGLDGGADSMLWLWRLTASSGWCPEAAILVARVDTCPKELLKEAWQEAREEVRNNPGEKLTGSAFSLEDVLSAGDDEAADPPAPSNIRKRFMAFLHAHDERYVLIAWNQSDYVGGYGAIDRLDLQTGEVRTWARTDDIWAITTDPRDGRVFCVTCYDGTDVLELLDVTVFQPRQDAMRRHQRILAQPIPRMSFGLAWHSELGGIVVFSHDYKAVYVICPPDSEGHAALKQQEGVDFVDALRPPGDDRTPGDRTSPWVLARVCPQQLAAGGSCEGHDARRTLCLTTHSSRVTFLEVTAALEVCSFDLLSKSGTPPCPALDKIRVDGDKSIVSFAGSVGSSRPLVIFVLP